MQLKVIDEYVFNNLKSFFLFCCVLFLIWLFVDFFGIGPTCMDVYAEELPVLASWLFLAEKLVNEFWAAICSKSLLPPVGLTLNELGMNTIRIS